MYFYYIKIIFFIWHTFIIYIDVLLILFDIIYFILKSWKARLRDLNRLILLVIFGSHLA